MQLCSYSQIIAALPFFGSQVFLFNVSLLFVQCAIQWLCSSCSGIHRHKEHEDSNDYLQQLPAAQYIFSVRFHLYYTCVYILQLYSSCNLKLIEIYACDCILENLPNCLTRPNPFYWPSKQLHSYTTHSQCYYQAWLLVCFSTVNFANLISS